MANKIRETNRAHGAKATRTPKTDLGKGTSSTGWNLPLVAETSLNNDVFVHILITTDYKEVMYG